jgi:hypothetical protein
LEEEPGKDLRGPMKNCCGDWQLEERPQQLTVGRSIIMGESGVQLESNSFYN